MPAADDGMKHDDLRPEAVDEDAEPRYHDDREQRQRDQTRSKFPQKTGDEKWQANLDYKLKPLLEEVDIVEYGGRDLQEYVVSSSRPFHR